MTRTLAETNHNHRQPAEEKAGPDAVAPLKALSLEEAQKLIGELRAHQIELEMQNDQLRRTQHELDISRERYFELYDVAPVGYLTLNSKGIVLESNLTASNMFGVIRRSLLNKPLTKFIMPEDQDIYYLYRKRVFETCELQACEIRMIRADGTPFWAFLQATLTYDGEYWITLSEVQTGIDCSHGRQPSMIEDLTASIPGVVYKFMVRPDGAWYFPFVSKGIETFFGVTQEEACRDADVMIKCILDVDRPAFLESLRIATKKIKPWFSEHRITTSAGVLKWIRGSALPRMLSDGTVVWHGILTDITELMKLRQASVDQNHRLEQQVQSLTAAEVIINEHRNHLNKMISERTSQLSDTLTRLTNSERFKQTIIDSLPANIAVLDQNGTISAINRPWLQFGRENGLLDVACISVGTDYLASCRKAFSLDDPCSESAYAALEGITAVLEGRETFFIMDYSCTTPSEKLWYQMSVMPMGPGFEGAIISHVDISTVKKCEEERRTYTSHLVEAIEQERSRTARELHDDLGQTLTVLSFAISQFKHDHIAGKKVLQTLLDMQTGVDRMMESIQRICTALRPALLDELGLLAALEWLCNDFSRRSGIPCSFTFGADCCSSDSMDCSMTVFRIVQESLNNTMKHAGASKASISLCRNNDSILLEINDDGCGITTDKRSACRSFGIIGMRERANSLGADFDIISNTGLGTRVSLVIPCYKIKEGTDEISNCR